MQILVDSPVWVDYFCGRATPEAGALDRLLGASPLLIGDFILEEVLAGLPDEHHRRQAREALLKFWRIEMGGFDLAVQSAVHYHTLKARGIGVHAADCRIATFCIARGFALLGNRDRFAPFERHLGLTVVRA